MIGDEFPDLADVVDDGLEGRCYPSASDILVFRYRDDPPAYAIKARFAGISELLKELRAPDDANRIYCVKFSGVEEVLKTGDLSPRFKNYSVERVGLKIGTLTRLAGGGKLKPLIRDSKLFISQPSYWHERPNFLIQVWRTRVFACPVTQLQTDLSHPLSFIRPISMYLEERWYPTRGKDRYLHWAVLHQRNNSRIEQFRRDAVKVLEGARKLGRPPGTKIHNSREEFIREYRAACSKAAQGGEGEPDQVSVASEMGISVSTLQRRLREFSITWPPISSRTGV